MGYSKFNQSSVNFVEKLNPKQVNNLVNEVEGQSIAAHVAEFVNKQTLKNDPLGLLPIPNKITQEKFLQMVRTAVNAVELARRNNYTAVLLLPEGQTSVGEVLQRFELYKFLFA